MNTAKQNTLQARNSQLVLTNEDHHLLLSWLRGAREKKSFDRHNAEDLETELKGAMVVDKDNLPPDVVRINSTVRVKMEGKNEVMEFTLVTPDRADIREKRISVLAPIGTALIGFRKGQHVQWHVPAGRKTFVILDVKNDS